MAPKRKQQSETSLPSKRLKVVDTKKKTTLIPPSFHELDATLNAGCDMMKNKTVIEKRLYVIEELRRTSARSVACGQQFLRGCPLCLTESPLRRATCSIGCGAIVCSTCADKDQINQCCGRSSKYTPLFENESRECLICMEIPFSRVAFSRCGHIICAACSLQLRMNEHTQGLPLCPYCRAPSSYLRLFENVFNPPADPIVNQTNCDNSNIPSFFIARLLGNLEECASKQTPP